MRLRHAGAFFLWQIRCLKTTDRRLKIWLRDIMSRKALSPSRVLKFSSAPGQKIKIIVRGVLISGHVKNWAPSVGFKGPSTTSFSSTWAQWGKTWKRWELGLNEFPRLKMTEHFQKPFGNIKSSHKKLFQVFRSNPELILDHFTVGRRQTQRINP